MTPCHTPGDTGAGRQAWQSLFLEGLRATGNVSEAARAASICRSRVYDCRHRDADFAAAWADALEEAAIAGNDWNRAADEALDSRWARQTGRRANETAALFRGG